MAQDIQGAVGVGEHHNLGLRRCAERALRFSNGLRPEAKHLQPGRLRGLGVVEVDQVGGVDGGARVARVWVAAQPWETGSMKSSATTKVEIARMGPE